ncbi:hypothetical protein ACRZOU_004386 [Aeromonas salmonicida]
MEISYFLSDINNPLSIIGGCFFAILLLTCFMFFKASFDSYIKYALLKKGFHSSEIQSFVNKIHPNPASLKADAVRYFCFGLLNFSLFIYFFLKIA